MSLTLAPGEGTVWPSPEDGITGGVTVAVTGSRRGDDVGMALAVKPMTVVVESYLHHDLIVYPRRLCRVN